MRNHYTLRFLGFILILILFLAGCRHAGIGTPTTASISPSPSPVLEETATATATQITYPQPSVQIVPPTSYPAPQQSATVGAALSPTAGFTAPVISLTPTNTQPVTPRYPPPGGASSTPRYPGPVVTNTSQPYIPPETRTPFPTRTPRKTASPTSSPRKTSTQPAGPTAILSTPLITATELPPRQPISPPPAGSSVTIWHSWNISETETLRAVTLAFQRIYPDVTFSLLYVPLDDLFSTYQEAAYLGKGPNLLLGPASWGPQLFDQDLITDLTPYVPTNYLSGINQAALTTGEYGHALISLPLSQHGMLMFRNTSIIDTAPGTFDQLSSLSSQATHGGMVGSYLERGAYFSSADIIGLGGRLMDEAGYPKFNDSFGVEWLSLLADYDTAGAVTFNTNRDLDMFKRSRVGIIIDGSWNIKQLANLLGPDNLAIDPWPDYGMGHLSGWVEADSVFLNANTTGNDRFAALSFIGYLLDPGVQTRLAELGHIPSVTATVPRDPLIRQAMAAFSKAATYPIIDPRILQLYWNELDAAIRKVFVSGVNPSSALKDASDHLIKELDNLKVLP